MTQKNDTKKCDGCNRIISSLYEKLEKSNVFCDSLLDNLSKRNFVKNLLYDGICDITSQKLLVECVEGRWNEEFKGKLYDAYELMAENWSVLNKKTMHDSYYPIVEQKFKQLYKHHALLCDKLFPVVFFAIIDNIQKLKGKKENEVYEYIKECLFGVRREDYIFSILDDKDKERKKLSGKGQRERFQKILFKSESDIINSEKTKILDLVELGLVDWDDETIHKNEIWIDKFRQIYLRKHRREEKIENAEKMIALFQFISATWESKSDNKWYSYDRGLTLYVINQMTSWINLLFLHLYKANYMILFANASLYSVSNYLTDERNKQRGSREQSNFFMRIADLSCIYELIEEAYTSGKAQDKLELKKGLENAAEHILEVIRKYLKNPDQLLMDQAINYVLYIYLSEMMEREEEFKPSSSLEEKLENYFATMRTDEYLDDGEFPC